MPRARMASVLRCAEHTGNALGDLEEISSHSRNADPPTDKASKTYERMERSVTPDEAPCSGAFRPSALHLDEAAIHKHFRACDVTAIVGGEEHHGLRDLIGGAKPAKRNAAGKALHVLSRTGKV